MAKQVQPLPQYQFGGVMIAGHPLVRMPGSCVKCENFRLMPGNWLRLRSGRRARMYQAAGSFRQIGEFRPQGQGYTVHPAQHFDGTTMKWRLLSILTWVFDPASMETISGAYDGNFSSSNIAALANLRDRMVLYNGLGVRDATNSRPPFSSTGETALWRYFGLDAYCPSGNPTVGFAAGAGNNQVITSLKIFVGLHNTVTQHYSNGVLCGTLTTTGATGTITVSNLDRLKVAYHDNAERNELKYVFYASIDGGSVPYLILNSTGTGPHTVAVTDTTAALSIVAGYTNGWILDLTGEMPTDNFPPKPMRGIAYVNGRLYGIPLSGGSGSAVLQQGADGVTRSDFAYQPNDRYLGGIVYSAAASDGVENDRLGSPEESWPLSNFSPTPNSERPLKVDGSPGGDRVLVLTPKGTFLVEEAPDGIHEWISVSLVHGIGKPESYTRSSYGSIWVTHRNQIVLLRPGSRVLDILSGGYQDLLSGKTVQASAYILDPVNEVDRYEVFFTDGTSVIHDFAVGGQGYTATNRNYTALATLTDINNIQHHVAAKQHLYTHEGQPEDGKIVTYDQDYTSPSTTADTEITGVYEGQWQEFGDNSVTKSLPHIDVVGDRNAQVDWFADLENVADGTKRATARHKTPQSDTDHKWRFQLSDAEYFWYKFRFTLAGHSSDLQKYVIPGNQGNLIDAMYGAIAQVGLTVSPFGENRP